MFHKLAIRPRQLAALAVAALLGTIWFAAAPVHAATNTVVSLTFDDGSASQYSTLSMLPARGMNGTYYINSGLVGSSGYYMTWSQLHDLYNAGNEIGGHTVDHKNLTQLSTADATAEVCNDRTNLINNGFSPVTSFAYPYAASNTSVEQIVQGCGYSSGRTVGNINSITVCTDCPYAETIPPRDPYYLRTPEGEPIDLYCFSGLAAAAQCQRDSRTYRRASDERHHATRARHHTAHNHHLLRRRGMLQRLVQHHPGDHQPVSDRHWRLGSRHDQIHPRRDRSPHQFDGDHLHRAIHHPADHYRYLLVHRPGR